MLLDCPNTGCRIIMHENSSRRSLSGPSDKSQLLKPQPPKRLLRSHVKILPCQYARPTCPAQFPKSSRLTKIFQLDLRIPKLDPTMQLSSAENDHQSPLDKPFNLIVIQTDTSCHLIPCRHDQIVKLNHFLKFNHFRPEVCVDMAAVS